MTDIPDPKCKHLGCHWKATHWQYSLYEKPKLVCRRHTTDNLSGFSMEMARA